LLARRRSVRQAIEANPEPFRVEQVRLPPSAESSVSREAVEQEMRPSRTQLLSAGPGGACCSGNTMMMMPMTRLPHVVCHKA
jgi:hypothetical protein